jgi:hypothetical protein
VIQSSSLFQVPTGFGKPNPSAADLRPLKTREAQKNEAPRSEPAGPRLNGWRAVLLRLI